jgi:hypothetical protein
MTEEAGKELWQAWMEACADMQGQLNDCSLFLAAFDTRKGQTMIDALLEAADDTRARILPRRKFAFSKKAPLVAPASAPTVPVAASAPAPDAAAESAAAAHTARLAADEETIEGRTGEVIIIPVGTHTAAARVKLAALEAEVAAAAADGSPVPAALVSSRRRLTAAAAGKDLRLLSLSDCTILLLDTLRAVRVDGLQRCTLITGAVAGSVLLHNCVDSTFHFAARQLRLHTSTRCDFYLHCLSRPIIEHCTAFRFGQYGVAFEGLGAEMSAAGLDKPSLPDLWRSVDDFNWHRTQASPNWAVLTGPRMGEAGGPPLPPAAVAAGVSVTYPAPAGEAEAPAPAPVPAPAAVEPAAEDEL